MKETKIHFIPNQACLDFIAILAFFAFIAFLAFIAFSAFSAFRLKKLSRRKLSFPFFSFETSDNNKNGNNGCGWRDTLPSARTVSHLFHTDTDIPSLAVTHMVTQWGQFLDHDITGTPEFHSPDDCCADPDAEECINISVGAGLDSFYNPLGVDCLSLHRSEPFCEENEESGVTREHFNINTHFVDQSNVYGHSDETAISLRTLADGLLKVLEDENGNDLLPEAENDDGEIVEFAGDFRAREMPGLLSMHTLFVREHNRIAGKEFHTLQPANLCVSPVFIFLLYFD